MHCSASSSAASAAASRAHAFDALALDAELESLLQDRWESVCSRAHAQAASFLQPELQAALRGALWYFSAFSGGRSPGQALLNLHCAAGDAAPEVSQRAGTALAAPAAGRSAPAAGSVPRSRRLLHGALVVLIPWLWARLARLTNDPEWPERLRWVRWMRRAEGLVAVASLLVALRFLRDGRHPSLPMALLGMRLVYTAPEARPGPVFELMEQQLVWRTLADTAVAMRALLHSGPRALPPPPSVREPAAREAPVEGRASSYLGRLRAWLRPDDVVPGTAADASAGDEGAAAAAPPGAGACVLCGADPPHTPQPTACGHSCCYFCFASARLANSRVRCPRCAKRLVAPDGSVSR